MGHAILPKFHYRDGELSDTGDENGGNLNKTKGFRIPSRLANGSPLNGLNRATDTLSPLQQ
jgi:hypothetical protein